MVLLGKIKSRISNNKFLLFMIVIMLILSTLNLGYRNMWVDEAINVVIGHNITEYGIPKVWDGYNLIGASGQAPIPEYTENLIGYKYDFLPRYLAGFSQLFGDSNFIIRIPFVIMGLISTILFYILVKYISKSKFVIYSALILYALSTQIIIYIRVAYYYAPVLLLMNLVYIYFFKFFKTQQNKWLIAYTVSLMLFYHLNHLFFGVALASTFVTFLLFSRKNIRHYMCAILVVLVTIIPFIIWRNTIIVNYGGGANVQNLSTFIMQSIGYIWNIQAYIFPFITLLIMLGVKKIISFFSARRKNISLTDDMQSYLNKKRINPFYFMLTCTIILNIAAISLLTYDYAARYLLGSIPSCYILASCLVEYIFRKDNIAKSIMILLLAFTNILNVAPYYCLEQLEMHDNNYVAAFVKPPAPFYDVLWLAENYTLEEYVNEELHITCYLKEYLSGVYKKYNDSTKGIEDFFKKYGKRGDTAYVYGNNSAAVIHYTGLQLVVPDNLPNRNQYPSIDLITQNTDFIDWIIVTASGADPYTDEDLFWVGNPVYECYVLEYYNAPCIPEVWNYYFELPDNLNRLLIYRNVLTTSPVDKTDDKIYEIIIQ